MRYRGAAIEFTALEFDLLLHFASHPGHVFSRAQLLDAVWGYSHDGYEHTVTTHINRLRAKLEADPMRPELILTVRGAGYKMREAPLMTVRLKLALTIFATGLLTALGVIAAVLYAFERFEHETTFQRANAFLGRVTAQLRRPARPAAAPAGGVPRLAAQPGAVRARHPALPARRAGHGAGHHRRRQAAAGLQGGARPGARGRGRGRGRSGNRYVMGDDPERMDDDAVIAARPLRRATIRNDGAVAGYLYLVCHKADAAGLALGGAAQQPGAAGAGADLPASSR